MMTPQEVASHAFAKATLGGYNMAMVDEFLDVHKVPFEQALQMVLDNTIRDSKTVAGILRYALMRRGEQ